MDNVFITTARYTLYIYGIICTILSIFHNKYVFQRGKRKQPNIAHDIP